MNYNFNIKNDIFLSELRSITAIPQDREELICAYNIRFIPMAFDEFLWNTAIDIDSVEKKEALIRKYKIRERVSQAKGDNDRLRNIFDSLCTNEELKDECITLLTDFAEEKAEEFVTSKRNRLRAKALLMMSKEEINKKELAYLRGEGEFWYNETEEE